MLYWELFYTFFKIGLFTIGGGYAMIPLIQQEITIRHQWISLSQLTDFIAVAESTPGPFAVNTATFVGMQCGGFWGAFCATFGVVLPSFVIILLIAHLFSKFSENTYVKSAMAGLRPAVLGLLCGSLILLVQPILFRQTNLPVPYPWYLGFSLLILVAIIALKRWKPKWHPIFLIMMSAVMGIGLFGILGHFIRA